MYVHLYAFMCRYISSKQPTTKVNAARQRQLLRALLYFTRVQPAMFVCIDVCVCIYICFYLITLYKCKFVVLFLFAVTLFV